MSVVEQFSEILKQLPSLKAPGVSGTRIKKLTDLAVQNVSEESKLIDELYACCKATPSSHKLGALYVVDSIVRIYMEEAKKKNQFIDSLAPEGTYAAGVFRISELVESLIGDALELLINPSTDAKIGKLVDIWERAQTFSPDCIARIRSKHFKSLTPPGSPRSGNSVAPTEVPKPATDSGSILLALASLAQKNDANTTPPSSDSPITQIAAPALNILSQLSALASGSQPPPPPPAAGSVPGQPASKEHILDMLSQMQNKSSTSTPPAQNVEMSNAGLGSQYHGNGGNNQYGNGNGNGYNNSQNNSYGRMNQQYGGQNYGNQGYGGPQTYGNQGNQGYSNQNYGGPNYNNNNPNMGNSNGPHYEDQGYGNNMNNQGNYYDRRGDDRRGRGENDFSRRNRSRSPTGRYDRQDDGNFQQKRGPAPGQFTQEGEMNVPGAPHYRPRNLGFDNTMPQGSFKVMSRTLFIGGMPRGMDERALASHLRPYAEVQSVIMNVERKHAFVKVFSRKEAEAVIQSFNKDGALPLRTRWGVGFGPRDCCNYQHGISIIPIQRLTEADKQWVVKAQWGGTGGEPLVSGMVVDEPDIEIGTGISSKAMSKKMPTNSTRNGPKSNRPGEADELYAKTSSMGGQQEYMSYSQGANPLSGLFNNQPPQNQSYGQGPGPLPNQGYQGYGNNGLSSQLQNFYQGNQ